MNSIIIILLVLLVIVFFLIKTLKKGNVPFWKAVQQNPDIALSFFKNNSCWFIIEYPLPQNIHSVLPAGAWDGPFVISLSHPLASKVRVYGKVGEYESSQQTFLQQVNKTSSTPNEPIKNNDPSLSVANEIAIFCFLSTEELNKIVSDFCKNSNIDLPKQKQGILVGLLMCLNCASSIIVLRNKFGEKAEGLIRKIYLKVGEYSTEIIPIENSCDYILSTIKYYTKNFTSLASTSSGSMDYFFNLSEMFLTPAIDNFENIADLKKSPRLPLIVSTIMGTAAKMTNKVLDSAKSENSYEPSFAD